MDMLNRKPQRLPIYDYSLQNYYYVTICTHDKRQIFGDVGKLNLFGNIAESELMKIPERFAGVNIDKYVVMPNHIHAIISIGCPDEDSTFNKFAATERSRPFPTLSTIVGLYKSGVSKRIHETEPNIRVWQKSFYDHVIRGIQDYESVWEYIDGNPSRWNEEHYPQ